eukprot:TRINITY_DN5226_c1_g1_i1.p1 TRINITY_DN5226_c1_g1~~TRINITY_DN5226_c1_g1_i1.p1  ORF type:complete len:174 (+),score=11.78 TRINITY_DN5226_c1_g1_i1:32-553(+)
MKGVVIFTFLAFTLYFCTAKPIFTDNDRPIIKVNGEEDFATCINVPFLGNTCLEIFAFPNNLTLGVSLIINGKVYVIDEIDAQNYLCLDDQTLLELISDIPALLPYKPVIDELIAILGFIPAEVFSICLQFQNLIITDYYASACPDISVVLMCFEQQCLYKAVEPFECFRIGY